MSAIGRAIALAFAFLTIVPVRVDDEVTAADLARARYAFPLVGLAIGLVLAGLSQALARLLFPPGVAALLLVLTLAVLTGALHLDGLADTADGLFLGGGSERRLAAMRDPHVGTFGSVALILMLLGKYVSLVSMAAPFRSLALLLAAVIGRTLILVAAGSAPYARPEGTGRVFVESSSSRDALGAAIACLVLATILAGFTGLLAAVVAVILAWGLAWLAHERLGGVTGDILGALVELGELIILTLLATAQSLPAHQALQSGR